MYIIQADAAKHYHEGFERTYEDIEEIVVHGTGGGANAASLFSWMAGGERAVQWSRGIALYHYLIDRNGDVYQLIDLDRWVYHSSSMNHDKKTIGIELMNPDFHNKAGYTDQQYISLVDLINQVILPVADIKRINSHRFNYQLYSGGQKDCPGPLFDWSRLESIGLPLHKDLFEESKTA